jgi:hypothetical protein
MAEFYVRNSLNLNKSVKFNITLRYYVIKGVEGESVWTLEIGTTYPDINGDPINPKRIYNVSAANFDDVIEPALAELCAQIDWSPLMSDKEAPFVESTSPLDDNLNVNINSNIEMFLKDDLPSAGIDLSNMKIILNNGAIDFDITEEIEIDGDPYEYSLKWRPPMRVYDTYD